MTEILDTQKIVQQYLERNGLKVVPPICQKCNRPCPEFLWERETSIYGGTLFRAIVWKCTQCKGWIKVPKDELDLLNKYTLHPNNSVYWPEGTLKYVHKKM